MGENESISAGGICSITLCVPLLCFCFFSLSACVSNRSEILVVRRDETVWATYGVMLVEMVR